ncbi:MAG: YHS domain-containing (seleno)protein [Bacteroidota bacterium]
MKYNLIILSLMLVFAAPALGQKVDYNTDKGAAAEGYDVVAYFSQKAVKGKSQFTHTHDGLQYKFASAANRDKFKANPAKYKPQYGGWCAYAMGAKSEKVSIDPETFEVRGGKLYLFYNAFFTNTHESWVEEGPEKLMKKADTNWAKIKFKKS